MGLARSADPRNARAAGDPYLGSDPLTPGSCLDKGRTKEILSHHGVRTAPFVTIASMDELEDARVRFPLIVKPLHEGSSKGIYNSCVARNSGSSRKKCGRFSRPTRSPCSWRSSCRARVHRCRSWERCIAHGAAHRRDFVCGSPRGMNPIYSYRSKVGLGQGGQSAGRSFPVRRAFRESLAGAESVSCASARTGSCDARDWSRIDVRLDSNGHPHILEVNPLPGILPRPEDNSCFRKQRGRRG